MPPSPPHQQRVINERAELDDRRSRLNSFMDTDEYAVLDHVQKDLLKRQYKAMTEYSNILGERIEAWA
jgi:hypothetical protein